MKKNLSALLLACAMLLGLTACGSSGDGENAPIEDGSASQSQEAEAVTIAPDTVLLDQDGLKITAKALEDSLFGPGIKLLLENNSDKNLSVSCGSLAVNNYMMSDLLFSASVAAGKKANETLTISSSDLEAAGITTIADIALSFHVFDSDSYSTLLNSPEIALPTSASGTVTQPALDEGQELFNQDGIRIVGRYVDEDSFWGAGVLLFMENTSDRNLVVQCDDMSVNGFMVTPLFSCSVNAGRMALDDISILSSELEENGIEAVEEVELSFRVFDPDSFDTVAESGPVTFTVS